MSLGTLFDGEQQYFDNAGAPLSGGKLFFYAAGTLTPQDTYSDASLTIGFVNANPVVLDSAGRAPIFLLNAAYKVILKTSADVVIWTLDNIIPPAYAATLATVPVVVTKSNTGTVNDLSVSAGTSLLRFTNGTDLTLTGLVAGSDGQILRMLALGAGNVFLTNQSGSSSAVNRFLNPATSGLTALAGGTGSATYVYDGVTQRWRLVSHEQGAWITYSAAYAGNNSQTFTSVSATTSKYRLTGNTLDVAFDVTGTVGGTPSTLILISVPFSAIGLVPGVYDNNGDAAVWYTTAASNILTFYKDLTLSGNWTGGSAHLLATARFDVS